MEKKYRQKSVSPENGEPCYDRCTIGLDDVETPDLKKTLFLFYFQLGHNIYVNVAITSQHRLSGQSYESGVSGVSVTSCASELP